MKQIFEELQIFLLLRKIGWITKELSSILCPLHNPLMVFYGMTAHGKTPLVEAEGSLTLVLVLYRDDQLRQCVMSFIRNCP